MTSKTWRSSARPRARAERTAEGWELALERAEGIWVSLTNAAAPFSDTAAAAIIGLALALWRDSSAFIEEGE